MMTDLSPIREKSPCYKCERPWKKPGCHDTYPDRKPWLAEVQKVKRAREEYEQSRFNKFPR